MKSKICIFTRALKEKHLLMLHKGQTEYHHLESQFYNTHNRLLFVNDHVYVHEHEHEHETKARTHDF